jgi:HPt (histidine-containing phosphotransfer) domain-containing protein
MQQLRKLGYTQPIVALTANAMIGQAEEFMAMGFNGFISKPIQTQNLHAMLLKFVKDKQLPEVIAAALAESVNKPAPKGDINTFQNDPILLRELKRHFAKNHSQSVATIRQSLSAGDIDTAHRLAHTIKSSAAMIYENSLSEMAKEMEHVLSKKELPTQAELTALDTELQRAIGAIGEPTAHTPPTPISAGEAIHLLTKLTPLLASRNTTSLSMLDDLRKIPQADLLCSQIEDFNFGDAQATLEALLTNLGGGHDGA